MDDVQESPKRGKGWAFVTSAVLHAVVAAMLFLKWPERKPEPPKDEAVKVDIVEDKDAPKQPEQKAAEQPPPPPPPAQEPAKNEQPPPPRVPIPTLRTIFQYGQKDEGPTKQDGSAANGEKDAADELTDKTPDAPKAEQPKAVTEEAAKEPPKDELPGVPDILKAQEQQESAAAAAAGKPVEEKAATPKPAEAPVLQKARKLYSENGLGGLAGVTAMGDTPRGARIASLCASELKAQLRHSKPPLEPEYLPQVMLAAGTVLVVPDGAFRAGGIWYNVMYRCEVDEGALRVVSFAFKVGEPVPRSEWRARRFPLD